MGKADHIYVCYLGFTHHGIDCGDETVIHYSKQNKHRITLTSLEQFSNGESIKTVSAIR